LSKKNNKESKIRDLPISLQGIEIILSYLNQVDKEAQSIRNISQNTGLSMRVAKNILLQLEKFNQIERVVEKNNILPKWKITKFGKRVIKEVKMAEEVEIEYPSQREELIKDIIIPNDNEKLKDECKSKQHSMVSQFNTLKVDLDKIIGVVIALDNLAFEDLMGFIMKRVKFLSQKISKMPSDPISGYSLKRIGEKQKKVSKEDERLLFSEIYLFNSLILNILRKINDQKNTLIQYIESKSVSNGYSAAKGLREEIRIIESIIYDRESISIDAHILSRENLTQLSNNKITNDIINEILKTPESEPDQLEAIRDVVLQIHSKLTKSESTIKNHSTELSDNIPLYLLYQILLEERPDLNFTIEHLEQVINSLADEGYIPGIKVIEEDENHFLKVVKFSLHDVSYDEAEFISHAIKLQRFTIADMVQSTGWNREKVYEFLTDLTNLGILKYTKSFLHGETWYMPTAWNWTDLKTKAKEDIEKFEINIRNFLKNQLKKVYKDAWWEEGIPENIFKEIDNKITLRQKTAPNFKFEKINFLEFSHYLIIISKKKNWNSIFSNIFPDKESIEYPLNKLQSFRNDLYHGQLNSEDLKKYSVYIDDFTNYF
jgi:predicted transcriptional regulator